MHLVYHFLLIFALCLIQSEIHTCIVYRYSYGEIEHKMRGCHKIMESSVRWNAVYMQWITSISTVPRQNKMLSIFVIFILNGVSFSTFSYAHTFL